MLGEFIAKVFVGGILSAIGLFIAGPVGSVIGFFIGFAFTTVGDPDDRSE